MNDQIIQQELFHKHDYGAIKEAFLQELINASQNQLSSISFIEHVLPEKPLITKGIIQGIVIGGTNYIRSTEQLSQDGKRTILTRKTGTLPLFDTKQTLIQFLSEQIDERAEAIGVNFGFPLKPTVGTNDVLDGQLIYGTKEHTFTNLTEPIGQLTQSLFLQKYKKTIPVSVANDTVCLLLAGNGAENASLIAGTGVNIGIRLSDQKKRSIINLEAGNFNRFALPDFLKIIDAASEKPGNHLFEKATSGKYLANVFNTLIQQQSILVNPIRTSQELSTLSYAANKDASGDVARMILQQSAFLIATAIAALYAFYQMPKSLTIIGEGSLLWKGWNYQENIQIKLKDFAIQKDTIQIKHIQDSSINGAIGLVVR